MNDLSIRGGLLVDGTGRPGYPADVGIRGGQIVEIGEVSSARRVIEVDGQMVAPGFIDLHTHIDAQACWDPTLSPSPLHGVTTMIGGNCGFTLAPTTDEDTDYLIRMLSVVEGIPLEALKAGVRCDWRSSGEFLDRFERGLAANTGFMVGHSALRRVVLGDEASTREAEPPEVDKMAELLRTGLGQGALGFSSSWGVAHMDDNGDPVPSRLASADELLILAAQCRNFPGTSIEFLPKVVDRFDEEQADLLASMSVTAGRPLNWNVLRLSADGGSESEETLRQADYARERGGTVIALTLPIPSRARFSFLSGFVLSALPGWGSVFGLPRHQRLRALQDPAVRTRLAHSAASATGSMAEIAAWDQRVVTQTFNPALKKFEGKLVGDMARSMGKSSLDVLLDIACEDELRTTFARPGTGPSADDWKLTVSACRSGRAIIGGSDAGAHVDFTAYFDYPVFLLAEGARRHSAVTVEEAVQMLTSVPADLYGLRKRGRLVEGAAGDITIFDADSIESGPIFTKFDLPGGAGRLYAEPTGISYVLVNGVPTVEGGSYTGARQGSLIRAGRDTQ